MHLFDQPLARQNDPSTSTAAAAKAKEGMSRSVQIVRAVMSDGIARTDEQIHRDAMQLGMSTSPDRIRHGRKWLADNGHLHETGERRRTSSGGTSRVWLIHYSTTTRKEADGNTSDGT